MIWATACSGGPEGTSIGSCIAMTPNRMKTS
jgi:hypothetical protein